MNERGHPARSPALDLRRRVCNERERGMTRIAVDPDFVRNRFTFKKFKNCAVEAKHGPVNRLSLFVIRRDGGDSNEFQREQLQLAGRRAVKDPCRIARSAAPVQRNESSQPRAARPRQLSVRAPRLGEARKLAGHPG